MASHDPKANAILDPQELASVDLAQNLFSARAKESASELTEVLRVLKEVPLDQLVGRVAVAVEDLTWEARRDKANSLREVAELLGHVASSEAEQAPEAELAVVPEEPPVVEAPGFVDQDDFWGEDVEEAPPLDRKDPEPETQEAENEIKPENPLNEQQTKWIATVLGEENIGKVEALSVTGRLKFAQNLGKVYENLRIRRLSPQDKKNRIEQMTAFMGGRSYSEIGKMTSRTPTNIRVGLSGMAERIQKNIPNEELIKLIPKGKAFQEGADPTADDAPLNKQQVAWYKKVFGEDELDNLGYLNAKQKEYLGEHLGRFLSAFVIRRDGPYKTQRRVTEMGMLIKGYGLEKISEEVTLPVETLKHEIHSTAMYLQHHMRSDDLQKIIQETKSLNEPDQQS